MEPVLDPELPIVDAHHHLWLFTDDSLAQLENDQRLYARLSVPTFRRNSRYLLEEYLSDINTGHNVRATVYIEAHAMYRKTGPQAFRSVGEVEFANGTASMAASGMFGPVAVCAAIVGNVDLRMGDAVEAVLHAHLQAGGARFRGVRSTLRDPNVLEKPSEEPHIVRNDGFRAGFKYLEPLGLSFEAWMFEPQLPQLIDLARAFASTHIAVNHTGGPVGVGRFSGRLDERFPIWRESIRALAQCPNVTMKLGGLGLPNTGFSTTLANPPASSVELAQDWLPYIQTCIELFGANRCMFESNFPVDSGTAAYPVIWNAFKRTVSGASHDEKKALFSGSAARVYHLDV